MDMRHVTLKIKQEVTLRPGLRHKPHRHEDITGETGRDH